MEGQRTRQNIEAVRERVLQLRSEGYKNLEIADMVECSKSTVFKILRNAGLTNQKRSLSDAEKERILELRAEGKTMQKIAEEIGFSFSAVQRCIKASKEIVEQRDPEPEPEYIPPVQERKPEVKTVYINGKRYRDVTAFFMG